MQHFAISVALHIPLRLTESLQHRQTKIRYCLKRAGEMGSFNFFTLHDLNNTAYGISQATNDKSIAGFPNNVLTHPGDKVNGLIVFEVPQNAKLVNLVYDDHSSVGPYGGYAGNVTVKL